MAKFKSGFVTIVGKPNSGKSTLLNSLIKSKVSIATHKKNTTRNQIRGIYNDEDSQIIFIDTPGFISVKTKLDEDMHQRIVNSLKGVDIIIYLLPFWKELDDEYLKTIELTSKTKSKKYLLLTKVDKAATKNEIYNVAKKYLKNNVFDEIIPISSFRNVNLDTLISLIKKDLNDDVPYYDTNSTHENSDKFYSAEIIREKILFNLNNEIPHRLFVSITDLNIKQNVVYIRSEIIVDKENIRKIIIGKDGSKIKTIGQKAKEELEKYFDKKVFVETYIKVRENWQNKDSIIKKI